MPELATPQLWTPPRGLLRPGRDFDIGIPRNGLDTDHDPYLDTYGRNCLPANADLLNSGTGWTCDKTTLSAGSLLETATTGVHMLYGTGQSLIGGVTYTFQKEIKANGRNFVFMMPRATSLPGGGVLVNLTTGASSIRTQGRITAYGSEKLSDGYVRAWIRYTLQTGDAGYIPGVWVVLDDGVTFNYAGDAAKGVLLRNPQLNLGPQLFPYSAPAGAPVTLQAVIDRSGNAQNDQIGSTAGTDANDLPFNGWGLLNAGTGALYAKGTTRNLLDDWSILTVIDTQGVNSAGYGHIFDCGRYRAYIEGSDPYNLYVRGACATTDEIFAAYNVIPAGKSVIVITSDGSVSENGKIRAWVNGVEVVMRCIQAGSGARTADGPMYYLNKSDGASPFKGVGGRRIRASRTWSPSEAVRASLYLVSLMAARNVCAASAFTHSALKMPSCLARAESDYDPYMDTFGRNCLTAGYQNFDVGVTGLTRSDATGGYWQFLEQEPDDFHRIVWTTAAFSAGVDFTFNLRVRAVGGITQFMIRVVRGADPFESAIFDLGTGAVTSCHANLTASIESAGGGEYVLKVYVKATANAVGSIQFGKEVRSTYVGNTALGFIVGFPQINLGSTLWPYAAPSGAPGTLQSVRDRAGAVGQNLVKWSENPENAVWGKYDATFSGNKLTESVNNAAHFISVPTNAATTSITTTQTLHVTAKKGERKYLYFIAFYTGVSSGSTFDLDSGVWVSKYALHSGHTAEYNEATGTWDVSLTFTPTPGLQYILLQIMDDAINGVYTGDGTSGLYIYKAWLAAPGSAYVRTYDNPYVDGWHDMVGSTVGTDANDVPFNGWGNTFPGTGALYLKGDSRPLGDEWTMFVVVDRTKTSGVNGIFGNSGFSLFVDAGGEFYFYDARNSTMKGYKNLTAGTIPANKVTVIAVRYSLDGATLWVNGSQKALTYSEAAITARTEGARFVGYDPYYTYAMGGTIGRRIVVPEAMTDAEIEEVSAHLVALQAARGYPVTA